MPLTASQLQTIKNDILAQSDLNVYPNNSDGNSAIAALYNALASPDWYVWQTAVAMAVIADAINWANFTPQDAAPTATVPATPTAAETYALSLWQGRSLACQGKQFNLQTLLMGRESLDASKVNLRAGLQDALTAIPSGANGAAKAGGWNQLQPMLSRKSTRLEKLLASGTGTQASPGTMGFEGSVTYNDIETARNS